MQQIRFGKGKKTYIKKCKKNDVVKKDVYNAKIKNIAEKFNLAINASLNARTNKVKGAKTGITKLVTNALQNESKRLKTSQSNPKGKIN